ncbi:uncharacterized protein LOC113339578 [Papaver somniferum]|uniref:uncharacterized protein LOC113339578 n=1 Tax=Papaver somniferum TaxID=3469 RepID=UPI000E70605D|nr:uncharacterized protein LOC113339578 [Papaver somniferum]
MSFGLKNAGATYQRLIGDMFEDKIHDIIEVYVDDMLVKSRLAKNHLRDLRETFQTMKKFKMKVNPAKCDFWVTSGKFLGYIITPKGIEDDLNKVRDILEIPSPVTVKDVQKLNGSLEALGRFVSQSSDICKNFFGTLKKGEKFRWTNECEESFQNIKIHLASLLVLQRHESNEVLTLYLGATSYAISAVLVRNEGKEEKPFYFINKTLSPAEKNCTRIEQMILALTFATQKLITYFQAHRIRVLTKSPIEAVLDNAGRSGRISKWGAQIKQFNIIYKMRTAIKAQVLADFLADFPLSDEDEVEDIPGMEEDREDPADLLEISIPTRWEVFVDWVSNKDISGLGLVFTTLKEKKIVHSFRLQFKATNNVTEYEGVIHALRLLVEMEIQDVRLTSDLQLVIRQIIGMYATHDPVLQRSKCRWRSCNEDPYALYSRSTRGKAYVAVNTADRYKEGDWRKPIHLYLETGELPKCRPEINKIKSKSAAYELRDDIPYIKSYLGPLLRCLSKKKGQSILNELHYGEAGNHSSGQSLSAREKTMGYFWPYMNDDAKQMALICEEFQRFGKKICSPKVSLNSVISPWPFAKRGIDILGSLHVGPEQRKYLIVSTDYFTKWVEAAPLKHIRDKDVFRFIWKHIICRFGVQAAIVSDNGKQLQGKNIDLLFNTSNIRKSKAAPIYPQSNRQDEITNKTIADNLKKKLDREYGEWCEEIYNVLWGYMTTRREATGLSTFMLTYGTEAILPTEAMIPTTRTEAWRRNISADLILAKLDDLEETR